MMSEEEKKATENLKKNRGVSFKEADVLSNLIEKQQKEIEEWRNGIRINDKVSIPKDIIRTKIQIYKDKKADIVGMLSNYERWNAKIEILQELLKEN